MVILKFVLAVIALAFGAVLAYVSPDILPHWIESVISIFAAIAGVFGLNNVRDDIAKYKQWFESKTKLGAVMVVVPVLVLSASVAFGFELADTIKTILLGFITAGGTNIFIGFIDAKKVQSNIES